MKEGFDKEIDSLLRRRARGAAAQSFADGDGAAAHLDADELGAFAEGALPSAARLAAASHLADCERCRGVAVALSRAAGGAAELKQAAAVPASIAAPSPPGWRAWAAALFSPRVLRYAVPAVAVSLVAVVSYVALRSGDRSGLERARNAQTTQTAPLKAQADAPAAAATTTANANLGGLVAQNPTDPAANNNAAPTVRQPSEGRGPYVGEVQPPAPVTVAPTGSGAGTGAAAADTAEAPPPPAASAEAPREMAKAPARPAPAEEPEQPSKTEVRDVREKGGREADSEAASNDLASQQRSRAAQNRALGEVQMPDGGARNQRRGADNNSNIYGGNAGTAGAAPRDSEREERGTATTRRSRPATRAERKADAEDDETQRIGETREAAGHRFRREGSAWVDVRYRPSMASTGVRRGSEAFRALVADVPVVGRVAAQLGGEVIVVVNGHAYRIR